MIHPFALRLLLGAAAFVALPAAALAQQQAPNPREMLDGLLDRILGPDRPDRPDQEEAATVGLADVLAADFRAEDRARDVWRHPTATLSFFRVEPGMTVAEYAPGGGWYTRVLAPYIAPPGHYLAINLDSAATDAESEAGVRAEAWPQTFAGRVETWTGIPASGVTAFESDAIPAGLEGSADRILIFRNIHTLLNAGVADTELRNLRRLLADDGLIGVVQHRAPESESWARANGSRGYVKQSDVVALFQLAGFELVDSSEINANPADTADWDEGVWTLPPSYTLGDVDRARYTAIGESDRMTLLFRKAN